MLKCQVSKKKSPVKKPREPKRKIKSTGRISNSQIFPQKKKMESEGRNPIASESNAGRDVSYEKTLPLTEELIPIRIDCMLDTVRIQDSFVWNLLGMTLFF
jgi:hypothetical protein